MTPPAADPSTQAFEMGRVVQGLSSMQASVSRIENKLDSVATKADMAEVRNLALSALKAATEAERKASQANTRLDSLGPWRQIGIAILVMLVAGALTLMGLRS